MRSLKQIQTELYNKRCLKLYNDFELKSKKKRGRGWIIKHIEAAEDRYAKQMSEFKLELYLDLTIKSIPNATWVQTKAQYLIKVNIEADLLIDLSKKRLVEIARQMKSHHSSYMMIVSKDEDELIIYKVK